MTDRQLFDELGPIPTRESDNLSIARLEFLHGALPDSDHPMWDEYRQNDDRRRAAAKLAAAESVAAGDVTDGYCLQCGRVYHQIGRAAVGLNCESSWCRGIVAELNGGGCSVIVSNEYRDAGFPGDYSGPDDPDEYDPDPSDPAYDAYIQGQIDRGENVGPDDPPVAEFRDFAPAYDLAFVAECDSETWDRVTGRTPAPDPDAVGIDREPVTVETVLEMFDAISESVGTVTFDVEFPTNFDAFEDSDFEDYIAFAEQKSAEALAYAERLADELERRRSAAAVERQTAERIENGSYSSTVVDGTVVFQTRRVDLAAE